MHIRTILTQIKNKYRTLSTKSWVDTDHLENFILQDVKVEVNVFIYRLILFFYFMYCWNSKCLSVQTFAEKYDAICFIYSWSSTRIIKYISRYSYKPLNRKCPVTFAYIVFIIYKYALRFSLSKLFFIIEVMILLKNIHYIIFYFFTLLKKIYIYWNGIPTYHVFKCIIQTRKILIKICLNCYLINIYWLHFREKYNIIYAK